LTPWEPTAHTFSGGSAQGLLLGGPKSIASFFFHSRPCLASYGSGTKMMP
jgi:hypothetical protein